MGEPMLKWGAILGIIGFLGGFVGLVIFTPEANLGPLLGIFITWPLGFVLSCGQAAGGEEIAGEGPANAMQNARP